MKKHPGLIAASIAGGGIGVAAGVMNKGEQLENYGASDGRVIMGSITGGITYGLAGAGIGIGTAGTVMALRKILGK
jgi:hypothetical protein